MLIESALATVVEAVVGGSLAEVALDGRDALLQQACDLVLIPADGLGVREVEHGILVGHATRGVRHVQPPLDDLWEEAVLRSEVGQLPQTGVETVFRELLQHLHGILETVFRKLVVTLPVDTEPARVEVNNVRGNPMCSQLTGDLQSLLLREVGDAAHPGAETPEGQHGRLARDVGIFVEDILGLAEEYEEVHLLIAHEQPLGPYVRCPEVAGHGCRGVHEDAIAAVREVEGHGLVLSVGLRALGVGDAEVYLLPHLVQRGERLAAAIDALAGSQREDRIHTA